MFKALWIAIALLGSSLCMTAEVRNPDHVQIGIVPLDDFPKDMTAKQAHNITSHMMAYLQRHPSVVTAQGNT